MSCDGYIFSKKNKFLCIPVGSSGKSFLKPNSTYQKTQPYSRVLLISKCTATELFDAIIIPCPSPWLCTFLSYLSWMSIDFEIAGEN